MSLNKKLSPFSVVIALILCLFTISCNEGLSNSSNSSGDTVAVEMIKYSDSSGFSKSDGSKCNIIVETNIAFPKQYKDKQSTEALSKLFSQVVLYAGDSLQVNDAISFYVSNILHQFDFSDAPDASEVEFDNQMEDVNTITNSTTITVYYNKNSIVTFCKVEVIKKDDKVTSITHKYYSFDLENMCFIVPSMMFREESQSSLCAVLKNQLCKENKVASIDQLNELGFYNIENMMVTRNFYFGDKGITWSYLPNELAVAALGEPTVTLEYDALEPYMCENSIIERLR